MNIKPYIWDIWDISHENDEDIGVGLDMFLANVEQGFGQYAGADEVDYQALHKLWAAMDDKAKGAVMAEYKTLTDDYYAELTAARREGDRAKFEAILEV